MARPGSIWQREE